MKRAILISIILISSFAFSATINVPGDYSTIQDGINVSISGDTVLVADGHYYETISMAGKNISLLSENGPENTIIDGYGGDTTIVVLMSYWGESIENVISGFTVKNGTYGLYADFDYGNPLHRIIDCIIMDNVRGIHGHGPNQWLISNTLFYNNDYGFSKGYYGSDCSIINCTFDNITKDIWFEPSYGTTVGLDVYNSILMGQISGHDLNPVNLYYCDYVDGNLGNNVNPIEGNISADPLFVDPTSGDYHLQSGSPCIDTGDLISFYNEADGSRNDMGYTGGNSVFINRSIFSFGYVSSNNIAVLPFRIDNHSNSVITISDYTSNNNQFNIDATFPFSISPGDNIAIDFIYSPNTAGTSTGTITVDVSGLAGASTAEFKVDGYGIIYSSGIINVPEVAPTIQSAIDIASDGDTILVSSGTYSENVYVNKDLTILSTDGPEATIIDGNGSNGIEIEGGSPGNLNGFTFINCDNGIALTESGNYQVLNCIFKNNTVGFNSGRRTEITISNSLFINNDYGFAQGYYGSDCIIVNCTFDNTQDIRFEPSYGTTVGLDVYNSILMGQISGYDLNPVNLYYCDFDSTKVGVNVNNIAGNFTEDALFVDPSNGDYSLQTTSPCIDAGDPTSFYNDNDGTPNDMGYTGGNNVFINHSRFDFGYCASGSVKNDIFIISNKSENTITLNSFNSIDAQFSVNDVFPLTIDSGSEQDLTLSFTPDVFGQCSGIITFNVTGLAGSSSAAITVEGYGIDYTSGSINVPSIAPTIQSAIDLISISDTIFIAPGTYIENVRFNHKSPVIVGTAGAESTIISAGSKPDGSSGNAFYIDGGGGELHGLSITNANLAIYIYGDQDYPLIKDCKIFSNNTAISFRSGSGLEIVRTLIYNNETGFHQHYYGGSSLITNCTFDNIQDIRFEPGYGTTCNFNVHNSILCGQISGYDLNPVNLYYSDFDSSKTGVNVNSVTSNITDDPMFTDQDNNNYHLHINSPCINSGNPDLNEDGIIWEDDSDDQDPDGTRMDIGAFYLHHITVSIPDTLILPGDTILIPLMVDFPSDSLYSSAAIYLSGYLGYLDFVGIVTNNTITGEAAWTYQYNENDTLGIIWLAGATDISSSGVLFYLKFYVSGLNVGIVPLTILSAQFDENYYPTVINSGNINIYEIDFGDVSRNGEISPYDASLILKYLISVEQLDKYQALNANVSLDSTISAMDASLILQYGVGLIDTLPYEPVGGELLASGNFSMSDQGFESGYQIELPIQLSQGDNILSFEGEILYNPDHLEYVNSEWSDLLEGFIIKVNDQDGHLIFAGAGSEPDGNTGVFTILIFNEKSGCPDETEVELNRIRLNEDIEQTEVSVCRLVKLVSVQTEGIIPAEYSLSQNYPNPFNPTTTIRYDIPKASQVTLTIYNMNGQIVDKLVSQKQEPGFYSVNWDARNVSTGMYFYRIQAEGFMQVKKMLLIK